MPRRLLSYWVPSDEPGEPTHSALGCLSPLGLVFAAIGCLGWNYFVFVGSLVAGIVLCALAIAEARRYGRREEIPGVALLLYLGVLLFAVARWLF